MLPLEVLPYEINSPHRNMEIDIELAEESFRKKSFFFRWYGWDRLCLSFGYSQKELYSTYEVDIPKVLRPTGGGILLHGWDISYAFTTPNGIFKSPLQLYRFISEIFIETFRGLGVEATFSRNKKGDYRRRGLCQLFPTFGEVTYRGKKLVASAVREFKRGNYLIHGSIYISYNPTLAGKYLGEDPLRLKDTVATLSELKIKKKTLMEAFIRNLKMKLKAPGDTHR
jgi:lipoate-protein ligase A